MFIVAMFTIPSHEVVYGIVLTRVIICDIYIYILIYFIIYIYIHTWDFADTSCGKPAPDHPRLKITALNILIIWWQLVPNCGYGPSDLITICIYI